MSDAETTIELSQEQPERWSVAHALLPPLQNRVNESIGFFNVIRSDEIMVVLKANNRMAVGCGAGSLLLLVPGLLVLAATLGWLPGTQFAWFEPKIMVPAGLYCLGFGSLSFWMLVILAGQSYRFNGVTRIAQRFRYGFSRQSFSAETMGSVQFVTHRNTYNNEEKCRMQIVDPQGIPLLRLDDEDTYSTESNGMACLAIHVSRLFSLPLEVVVYPNKASAALKKTLAALLPDVSLLPGGTS